MKSKVDILDLEYSSKGRDVDIAEPILSYLELKYNLKIIRKCCFSNWEYYLLKYRPRVLFLANGIGSIPQFHIVKTAHFLGIKVVTHCSEGDYQETEKGVKFFFWGWNKDNILYEDLHLEWSQRNIDLVKKYIGDFSNIKLAGAVGFDKYKLLSEGFLKKNVFLKRYNKMSYTKIVGIAGWGFDLYLTNSYKDSDIPHISQEERNKLRISRDMVNGILKEVINKQRDTLFVLKYHPLAVEKRESEFRDLPDLPNVLILQTEENIFDLINICDIWGAYESTTTMEAWLIGNKPTFLIQPVDNDFVRSKISEGSPRVKNAEDLQRFLAEYFTTGESTFFNQLESKRQMIIERIIQWSDGRNHQRAAEYIYDLYRSKEKKSARINRFILYIYVRFAYKKMTRQVRRLLRLPLYVDRRFTDREREEWHQIYLGAIKRFSKKYGLLV